MKIALAQINPTVGDLEGNSEKILDFHRQAKLAGADLVVFSEMVLTGYPPLDLLDRPVFVDRCESALFDLAGKLEGVPTLLGTVLPNPVSEGRAVRNVAVLLAAGKVQFIQAKSRLPTYDVFDEDRYFEPAAESRPAEVSGKRVGVTICEDIWEGPQAGRFKNQAGKNHRSRYRLDPVQILTTQGIDLLVNLSASPFHAGKGKEREELLGSIARRHGVPVLFVNQVGGNDSLLFDGRSMAMGKDGKLIARAEAFREDLVVADLDSGKGDMRPSAPVGSAEVLWALVLGLSDYLKKCGFSRVVLGLSGGVDSALVAYLAAEAAGADRVLALAMPAPYSSPHSRTDAEKLAATLGIGFEVMPIDRILQTYRETLEPGLGDITKTLVEENLQARIRGAVVMAHANRSGALPLATGNKSELAVGYCTLYGDMVGGLAPIGDLYKTQVYELANYINRHDQVIPRRIIERPPSAELRPDQTDQDTLPPYDVLDPVLDMIISQARDRGSIIEAGHPAEVVERIVRMVELSEFKRRQAAPVLRVSRRAFGAGRRIPIARSLRKGRDKKAP
jgi:NAD+ synthase/NAD+ synthase (glutamine-hydrolysing)